MNYDNNNNNYIKENTKNLAEFQNINNINNLTSNNCPHVLNVSSLNVKNMENQMARNNSSFNNINNNHLNNDMHNFNQHLHNLKHINNPINLSTHGSLQKNNVQMRMNTKKIVPEENIEMESFMNINKNSSNINFIEHNMMNNNINAYYNNNNNNMINNGTNETPKRTHRASLNIMQNINIPQKNNFTLNSNKNDVVIIYIIITT